MHMVVALLEMYRWTLNIIARLGIIGYQTSFDMTLELEVTVDSCQVNKEMILSWG